MLKVVLLYQWRITFLLSVLVIDYLTWKSEMHLMWLFCSTLLCLIRQNIDPLPSIITVPMTAHQFRGSQALMLWSPRGNFGSCYFSPWYFSLFSCSVFLILLWAGIASPTTTALFCSLSTTTVSGWFSSSCLLLWILKSHRTSVLPPIGTRGLLVSAWQRCTCTLS